MDCGADQYDRRFGGGGRSSGSRAALPHARRAATARGLRRRARRWQLQHLHERSIEPLLGYTVEEWRDDPDLFVRTLHPDDRDRVLAAHAHTHETHEPLSLEYRLHGEGWAGGLRFATKA